VSRQRVGLLYFRQSASELCRWRRALPVDARPVALSICPPWAVTNPCRPPTTYSTALAHDATLLTRKPAGRGPRRFVRQGGPAVSDTLGGAPGTPFRILTDVGAVTAAWRHSSAGCGGPVRRSLHQQTERNDLYATCGWRRQSRRTHLPLRSSVPGRASQTAAPAKKGGPSSQGGAGGPPLRRAARAPRESAGAPTQRPDRHRRHRGGSVVDVTGLPSTVIHPPLMTRMRAALRSARVAALRTVDGRWRTSVASSHPLAAEAGPARTAVPRLSGTGVNVGARRRHTPSTVTGDQAARQAERNQVASDGTEPHAAACRSLPRARRAGPLTARGCLGRCSTQKLTAIHRWGCTAEGRLRTVIEHARRLTSLSGFP